jgi:hypothetical protein
LRVLKNHYDREATIEDFISSLSLSEDEPIVDVVRRDLETLQQKPKRRTRSEAFNDRVRKVQRVLDKSKKKGSKK